MGTDVAEVANTLPCPSSFKVHHLMCTELRKLIHRISMVFPEIEAARPRCSSGIQALCLLNNAIEKAKLILQYCSESSKLYLAITGDVIVSRCQKSRNLLEQSLGQIQNMVPVMLAAEISQILDDLRAAIFVLDSSEEEAGKVVVELLQLGSSASDSVESSEIKAIQFAASRLHITSPKTILIEKRSIQRLLEKVGDNDPRKKNILRYLLYLLKKYGKFIMREQTENLDARHEESFAIKNSNNGHVHSRSVEVESHRGGGQYEAQINVLSKPIPPEEFKCPISLRLMYDPVVIASGQTFERMWIQKWFDEGNDTCPKTKVKLTHRSMTPNMVMKDLISKWCADYEITICNPIMQREAVSLDTSSTSIASFGSSMNDLRLPVDISNISLGSLDASYSSDTSHAKTADDSSLMLMPIYDDSHRYQSYANTNVTDLEFLSRLGEHNWESQCKVVEDVKSHLQYNGQARYSMSSENSAKPLIRFLTDARVLHDIRALKAGSQLLLAFVSQNRDGIKYLHEDAISLLASLLDSEVTEEALAMLEVLSGHQHSRSKITESGVLASILKMLDSKIVEFKERVITILHNLSSNSEICSEIVWLECIPKVVPFLNDGTLARHCIILLKNLCDIEDGRVCVAETKGCIASIAELLETGSHEDQEYAVAVLLSLCSQRVQYCRLVMEEGVIPALVNISVNGNDRGKVIAKELLRQLRDIPYGDDQEHFGSDPDASRDAIYHSKEKRPSSKTSGFFGKKFFSRPCTLGQKRRNDT